MYILKNAFVIDVASGEVQQLDILITDGIIVEIGHHLTYEQADVIDCSGKYIIPGLIDMHVHIKHPFAPYFTAAGVTTVRNTGGSIIELRDLIDADEAAGTPRIISADRLIDGPPGMWGPTSPYSVNITTREEAIAEVVRQVELKVDFIKVYGLLSADLIAVVINEAAKYGKEVSCDILNASHLDALTVAKQGMTWLEHASGITQMLYPTWNFNSPTEVWEAIDWEHPNDKDIQSVCAQLLAYNVKLCPTIVLYDQLKRAEQYWTSEHETTQHFLNHPSLCKHWPQLAQMKAGQNTHGTQVANVQKIAYTYFKMGGIVVAGTDTPAGIFTYPGTALHRELQLFVEAGFTPLEAIQAATIVPASALKLHDIGQIKQGYKADILLLSENPLADITNTLTTEAVIKGGRLYTPTELLAHVPSEEQNETKFQEILTKFEQLNLPVEHLL